jgi:4-hydroxythreonine-4-phosphate dehydrogenase
MLMGVPEIYVALFTEHIPYKDVPKFVTANNLYTFMKNLLNSQPHLENIAVLGLNPHSGDNGVLGDEEVEIRKAVNKINDEVGKNIFSQPIVPDIAFTSEMRKKFNFYIAIYHDQGLIPLKTLYFDDAINISLNLPIVRISVGHGTAFNIAYQKERVLNSASYLNTFNYFRNL